MSLSALPPRVDHFPGTSGGGAVDFWLDSADVLLRCGGQDYLAHSPVLALHSPHLAALVTVQRGLTDRTQALPLVSVLPAALPGCVSEAAHSFGDFLRELYVTRNDAFQWDSIADVLQLADYFGATGVLDRADTWLCTQLLQPQSASAAACQAIACQAFELAARHRLGAAMAVLLPWAVQCMARGSRCASVWYDGKQRCCRLKAAFEDSELKCLVLDAYWWSRQETGECPTCRCRPADIEAGWDTRAEWAAGPAGAASSPGCCAFQPAAPSHARATQHYAHLLAEARWAVSSATSGGGARVAAGAGMPAP